MGEMFGIKTVLNKKKKWCVIQKKQTVNGGWQRGDRDPVSRTNFNKIHASRFESVIREI